METLFDRLSLKATPPPEPFLLVRKDGKDVYSYVRLREYFPIIGLVSLAGLGETTLLLMPQNQLVLATWDFESNKPVLTVLPPPPEPIKLLAVDKDRYLLVTETNRHYVLAIKQRGWPRLVGPYLPK